MELPSGLFIFALTALVVECTLLWDLEKAQWRPLPAVYKNSQEASNVRQLRSESTPDRNSRPFTTTTEKAARWWNTTNSPWRVKPATTQAPSLNKYRRKNCTCTLTRNCGDISVNWRVAETSDEECKKGEICCRKLLDETEKFNDVDYTGPMPDDTERSTVRAPLCCTTPSTTNPPRTTQGIIRAIDLENEESDEKVDAKTPVCGVSSSHLNLELKTQIETAENKLNSYFGQFPWTLALILQEEGTINVHCGAALLRSDVAITAAHCVTGKEKESFTVRAGEWDFSHTEELYPHQDRRIIEIVKHPNYTEQTQRNDIALLFLNTPFNMANHIKPVCVPISTDNFTTPCLATGWGARQNVVKPAEQFVMKKVYMNIVMRKECQRILRRTDLGSDFHLSSTFICARGVTSEDDTCLGDGGGPLFCKTAENPRYVLVGITSWGKGCNVPGLPGTYANVKKASDWIMNKLLD